MTGDINVEIELVPKDSLGSSFNDEDGRHDEWYLSARGILTRNKHHLCALREQDELDVNDPIYYGRQFRDTVRYLPLCPLLRDSFQRDQRNHDQFVQQADLYWQQRRHLRGVEATRARHDCDAHYSRLQYAITCVIVGFTISTMARTAQEKQGASSTLFWGGAWD
ncbi:hypothetical protein K438DRAFT_1783433 [Mycena galopus ATCC 62051]|nr:hypothetical protein K438DRAFT_1783433 [Mycena galopus ATCC 62051]